MSWGPDDYLHMLHEAHRGADTVSVSLSGSVASSGVLATLVRLGPIRVFMAKVSRLIFPARPLDR